MPKETKDSAIEQIDSTVNEVVSNVENAKNVAMSLFHHNEQTVKTSNATLPIEVNAPYVRVKASSSNARIEFQNEYQQTINKEFYSGSIDEIIDLSKYGTTEYDVKYIRIFTNNASTAEVICLESAIAEIYIIEQEHLKYVVNKIAEFDQKRVDSIAEINNATTESKNSIDSLTISSQKEISSLTEAKSSDIATLTTAKMEDIASVTNAKLEDINNKATSQISAINNTALSQINAINKTSQGKFENMTIKYSDMCRTLGIEHEGIMLAKTSYNGNESGSIPPDIYSIDVSKFKYIEFGKLVVNHLSGDYEYTLPANTISIYLTNLKDNSAIEDVTTGKRYDVSLLNDLQFYVSYIGSGGYETTVNYKLYNKLEETTE